MPPLQPSACFISFFLSSISNNSPLAQLAGERIVALGPLVVISLCCSGYTDGHDRGC